MSDRICQMEMICTGGVPVKNSFSAGPDLKYFNMIHGGGRRTLRNDFSEQICYIFQVSKCRWDWSLGLCTTSVLAFGEPMRSGDFPKKDVFRRRKNRRWVCHCAAVLQTQVPKLYTDVASWSCWIKARMSLGENCFGDWRVGACTTSWLSR